MPEGGQTSSASQERDPQTQVDTQALRSDTAPSPALVPRVLRNVVFLVRRPRVIVTGAVQVVFVLFLRVFMWLMRFTRHGRAEFYPTEEFPWTSELESQWPTIRAELDDVLSQLANVPNIQEVSVEQLPLTQDDRWKTLIFIAAGQKIERNCRQCPQTVSRLLAIPDLYFAQFSILVGPKHLAAHRGPYKGLLNCHLALKVPENRQSCRMRVSQKTISWEEGKLVIFDDTEEHEVWIDEATIRVVLIFHVVRPLPFPLSLANRFILKLSARSPLVERLMENQQKWFEKIDKRP
jgi:ornithine lipid ester-linked acyl 2-hydroxylase